uniref:Survival of motor neuron-related-splicing factor 30 n=1 Tax=Rattus norvegicus TaxID=10116 RepID=A0A096MK12_RAT
MSEDLAKQLASYKAQLQQVEAALSGNGENEDLLKLKKDLQEVIELTKDLLSTQPSETLTSSDSFASTQPTHSWKVGDKCMAVWSEDGQCYEAEIEEIDEENGTAAITFAVYGNAEVTPLLNLKPVEEGRKAKEDSGNKPMSKKEMIAQQREYKKKKALKKAQRIKELEQEREDQKVKWQQFNNRAYSKNKKGQDQEAQEGFITLSLNVCSTRSEQTTTGEWSLHCLLSQPRQLKITTHISAAVRNCILSKYRSICSTGEALPHFLSICLNTGLLTLLFKYSF